MRACLLAMIAGVAQGMAAWAEPPAARLRAGEISHRATIPEPPAALRSSADARVVVAYHPTMHPHQWREALEGAGARILRYVPEHAFIVSAAPGVVGSMAGAVVTPMHPAYRLDDAARALALGVGGRGRRWSIEVFDRGEAAQGRVHDAIEALGGVVHVRTPEGFRMEATLTPGQLRAVAGLDDVHFIDGDPGPGECDMDVARALTGAHPYLSGLGFTGQGVRGEVFDTGVLAAHVAFQNPPPIFHPANGTTTTHGTFVYGCVFGDGTGLPQGTGMLPTPGQGILGLYTSVSQFGGAVSRYQHTWELVDPAGPYRAVFQNSSVGSVQTNQYTTISAEMDDIVLLFDLLICQSMGESGVARPQAWAKNLVGVGGVLTANSEPRWDDSGASSWTAADGRVKPDLCHVMDNIVCTGPGSPTQYVSVSGTSMSTAIASGAFGLFFQMWHEGVFAGFGGGASVFDSRPHAATARAMLVNSAYRYEWTGPGSNPTLTRAHQGWGMPHLRRLHEDRDRLLIVDESVVLGPGESWSARVRVPFGEPDLRATLVYADFRGTVSATLSRVNDLTLRLTAPDGSVYWGNAGLSSGNVSTPGGSPDTTNVIENVLLANPSPGDWIVEVLGSLIVADTHRETPEIDADFALVVAGGRVVACCVDYNDDGEVDFTDVERFLAAHAAQTPGDCAPGADLNRDGEWDFSDVEVFVGRYTQGC